MRIHLLVLMSTISLLMCRADLPAQEPEELPASKPFIQLDGILWRAHWSQNGKTIVTSTYRKPKDKDDKKKERFEMAENERFKTAEIWDAATGKRLGSLGELEIPNYPFFYLSADGGRLVISQGFFLSTGEMEVWDASRPYLKRRIETERRSRPMECIAVSPKGDLIAELYFDIPEFRSEDKKRSGGIILYEAATGDKIRTLREEKSFPRTAVFAPDSQTLITRGSNDVIRLWDIKSGKVIREAQASLASAGELALSPDGKKLIIPTAKHEALQVWSVPELKPLAKIAHPFATVMRAEFSPSGKRLLVTGYRQAIEPGIKPTLGVAIWDLSSRRLLHDWKTQTFQCGFCGEDQVGVGHADAIFRYAIISNVKK